MRQPAERDPVADPTLRTAVQVDDPSSAPDDAGDAGYAKTLQPRHIGMIAIGGAIGTGLFLGAGASLQKAGPGLAVSYAVAGIFAFFVVRALGELVVHRPSSGSFVSYARELLGESGAYVALGIISTWATIMICHLQFVRRARRGELERPAFRLFFSPVTELATLGFLLFVIVEMGVDGGTIGRWTVALIVPITASLVFGWKARGRRLERADRP